MKREIKEQNKWYKAGWKDCEKEIKSLKRAMETIDKVATINNEDEKNKVLLDIYTIAHAFSGTCRNPHEDWKKFEAKMANKLKDY